MSPQMINTPIGEFNPKSTFLPHHISFRTVLLKIGTLYQKRRHGNFEYTVYFQISLCCATINYSEEPLSRLLLRLCRHVPHVGALKWLADCTYTYMALQPLTMTLLLDNERCTNVYKHKGMGRSKRVSIPKPAILSSFEMALPYMV